MRLRDHIQDTMGISDIWMDLSIPSGTPWADVINQELEKSIHLVLIWTPNAAYSENVTYE